MMHVLLVEDDELIGQVLYDLFQEDGHAIDWKIRGNEGKQAIQEGLHDIPITHEFSGF